MNLALAASVFGTLVKKQILFDECFRNKDRQHCSYLAVLIIKVNKCPCCLMKVGQLSRSRKF